MTMFKLALCAAVLAISVASPVEAAQYRSKPSSWHKQYHRIMMPLILGVGY
jgi:hypothetical protein